MSYKVVFDHPAIRRNFEKSLKALSIKLQDDVMEAVSGLAANPRPYGIVKIKPPVSIYNFIAEYRLRVGNYRVLYDMGDKKKVVSVIALRKRDEKTYN